MYTTGVYTGESKLGGSCSNSSSSLDHAVLLVGYGTYTDPQTKVSEEYFILKNTWGSGWGDNGYAKILYTEEGNGTCGINIMPVIATTTNDPKKSSGSAALYHATVLSLGLLALALN